MIYLFFTAGSGNRGCEAIVRGTRRILTKEKLMVFSSSVEQDIESGLNDIVICKPLSPKRKGIRKLISYMICGMSYRYGNSRMQVRQIYSNFLHIIKSGELYLVIGGDVYCYDKPRIYYRVNEILKKNKKILWGCSIEPKSIDSEMKKDLLSYDLIYARESITYEGLISSGIKDNVVLFPDPAFSMEAEKCALPDGFVPGKTVGINVSPLIMERESKMGITFSNYKHLIHSIIDSTNFQIALIPHVIWHNSDDRKPLRELYDFFKESGRVILMEGLSAQKIKYCISQCQLMVAARTHASIAAYSTMVPTLVVGYSVKAKGIAKDIFGTYDHYTIPVQSLKAETDLTDAFDWILKNQDGIKAQLQRTMPSYINRLNDLTKLVNERFYN